MEESTLVLEQEEIQAAPGSAAKLIREVNKNSVMLPISQGVLKLEPALC